MSFDKYLVVNIGANVPDAAFSFTFTVEENADANGYVWYMNGVEQTTWGYLWAAARR